MKYVRDGSTYRVVLTKEEVAPYRAMDSGDYLPDRCMHLMFLRNDTLRRGWSPDMQFHRLLPPVRNLSNSHGWLAMHRAAHRWLHQQLIEEDARLWREEDEAMERERQREAEYLASITEANRVHNPVS